MMGDENRSRGRSDRSDRSIGSALEHAGERLVALTCDLVWDLTPPLIGLWWLRWRVARLNKEAAALRHAAKIHRSAQDGRGSRGRRLTARWQELEAEYDLVDRRLADLEERTREGSPERRKILVLIAFFLLGWVSSYLGWISDVLEVQHAFSLAVSGEPR